jgi:paraquat-inducible protein A
MKESARRHVTHATLRECPDCGLVQAIPRLVAGSAVTCERCGKMLRHTRAGSNVLVLALALTSLVLYCIAVWSPFISVTILGQQRDTTMISLPNAFADEGMWELGVVVLLTTIVMPLCKIASVLITLLGLRTANPPTWLPFVFRQYLLIGPWAMVEVFLLGVFVAYTRLGAIATVSVGNALYALAGLMLTMVLTDYLIDREGVWEELGRRGLCSNDCAPIDAPDLIGCDHCGLLNDAPPEASCIRCGSTLLPRKANSVVRTWALLAAAVIAYLPANIYPVMNILRLGSTTTSTILGGAQELLAEGMWPLALLVLFASVLVPAFKLIGLIFMLTEIHRGSAWRLRDRTRLYRVIEFIGRWSMIDVFMLATLTGLVQSGKIATITPGFGAICFASVVIFTMFAAICFDPRLMWDAAARRPAATPTPVRRAPIQTRHA